MAGKTLDLNTLLEPDVLGSSIANTYQEWEMKRASQVAAWEERQRYLFSLDTTTTSNAKLPWKNKTVTPKLTQIRDNLFANYTASIFPKRKWLYWEAFDKNSGAPQKRDAVKAYMSNIIEQPMFKDRIRKLILDYIDYGNAIAGLEWVDLRQAKDGYKSGYVGPMVVRLSPLDVVFNPTAPDFEQAPKIVRSLLTLGELKRDLNKLSTPDYDAEAIFNYCMKIRMQVYQHTGTWNTKNVLYSVAGFDDYVGYLKSNYIEVLTAYGDFYDVQNDKFYHNAVITIVDRHKVISVKTDESLIQGTSLYHCGWRIRQDNLWAMGPLDNLVGMQYRIDHFENLKADILDLIVGAPIKVKGLVEDFEWGPFARIHVDNDGDVEVLSPDSHALQANSELMYYMQMMEEMAGSPKEAAGFRTPGEKTAYEVQRLENAASRIFYSKIIQFEEFLERLLNGMLDMARRKIDKDILVRTLDDEMNVEMFFQVTPEDLSANGRLKPVAARNFAERAEKVQNLTNLYASAVGADQDIRAHFSSIKLAKMLEDMLDLQDYELVTPYIRLSEQQDAQQLANAGQEQTAGAAAVPGNPLLG